jgi:glycosyltransferase involved in cell wall biosynthesis
MPQPHRTDVLFVSTELAVGGAEHQVMELAVCLGGRGWTVAMVSLKAPRIALDRLEAAGIAVEHLGLDRAAQLPSAMFRFRRIVRQLRPRLVHAHMIHANLLTRAARIGSRTMPTLINTSHSDGEEGAARRVVMRLTDRLATKTTHVSNSVMRRYLARGIVSAERAAWIPNGVDLERFRRSDEARDRVRAALGIDDDTFVWLTVGGLKPVKRHDLLVQVFGSLGPEATLLIAGEGKGRPRLEGLIAASPAADRISLLGARADPEALMSAADGFVLCSDSEALPLVLGEAAACELPIVATDVGGCRELVDQEVSGVLVTAGDTETLEKAMELVAHRTDDERASMGRAGRDLMQARFDMDQVVTQWERLYGSLGIGPSTHAGRGAPMAGG